MSDIKFCSAAHRDFFLENMMKSRGSDCRFAFSLWKFNRDAGLKNKFFNLLIWAVSQMNLRNAWGLM